MATIESTGTRREIKEKNRKEERMAKKKRGKR
jgi:hypothetical protein